MYLSIDTETGGLGLDKSLLSVGLVFADEEYNIIDEVEFLVRPDDGVYKVEAGGLMVNKIDLIKHQTISETYKNTKTPLYNLLQYWSHTMGYGLLIPVGKNVSGDISQIQDKIITRGSWESYVSYRPVDINTLQQVLAIKGKLDPYASSLETLCASFNIPYGNHTALGDARSTLLVLKEMMKLF